MNKSYQKRISILPAAALLAVGLMASVSASAAYCTAGFNQHGNAYCTTPNERATSSGMIVVDASVRSMTSSFYNMYVSLYKIPQGGSAHIKVASRAYLNIGGSGNEYGRSFSYSADPGLYYGKISTKQLSGNGMYVELDVDKL